MFSIIIPAYNSEHTIGQALDSLKRQTKKELIREIIIVDDGSADNTAAAVKDWQKTEPDMPVRLICQQNAGPSAARNAGMREASAEYLAFLDSDDVWMQDKLELQAEVLRNHPHTDLLCGGIEEEPLKIFMKKYDSLHHLTLKEYCIRSVIYTSTVAIRREAAEKAGFFQVNMRYCEDMNYYQRFFTWDQVYYLPRKLAEYGVTREYYGQNGLASDLYQMKEGRKYNFKELRKERKISVWFYLAMVWMGELKYIRRKWLVTRDKKKEKV